MSEKFNNSEELIVVLGVQVLENLELSLKWEEDRLDLAVSYFPQVTEIQKKLRNGIEAIKKLIREEEKFLEGFGEK